MKKQIIAEAEKWLKRSTPLRAGQRASLSALAPTLHSAASAAGARLVGIGGPPGSGKSTLARMLSASLRAEGLMAHVVSLDDYYLTRADRAVMAAEIHPLFETRGVPATHDLGLLLSDLDGLLSRAMGGLVLPQFDKASDDRLPGPGETPIAAPDLVLLEGWCVGCPGGGFPGPDLPLNQTEHELDPRGAWRAEVAKHLERYEALLHSKLDLRWFMAPPNWECVVQWRWQQEQELGDRRHMHTMEEVRNFLATFERLGRHMLQSCNDWADLVIHLDLDHHAHLQPAR